MVDYNDEVANKIREYRERIEEWNQHQKALAEERIWDSLYTQYGPGLTKRFSERREFFVATFGGSPADYEARAFMLKHDWTEPLWARIDAGMSLGRARRMYQLAKKQASAFDGDNGEALGALLGQRATPKVTKTILEKPFIQQVEMLLDEAIAGRIYDLNPADVARVKRDYDLLMREAYNALRADLDRLRRRSRDFKEVRQRVTHEQFAEACDTLGIKAKFGADLDLLDVKRRMLARAAQLHPDKTKDESDSKVREYQRVVEARLTLERYQEQRK